MREKLMVTCLNKLEQNRCLLITSPELPLRECIPTGQMLVDSEQHAFLYIIDYNEEYIYVVLNEEIWPELKEIIDSDMSVYLDISQMQVELTHFSEELGSLVENIKGNSNYGEAMVKKVEAIF